MDIAGIYHSGRIIPATCAADDNALGQNFFGLFCPTLAEGTTLDDSADSGLFAVDSLLAPFLRRERNMAIDSSDLTFGRPAGGTVLTVADGFAFDVIQRIDVCQQGDAAQHTKHNGGDDDQSGDITVHSLRLRSLHDLLHT